jgi:D-3-phosphoglycerate dehydrogenase
MLAAMRNLPAVHNTVRAGQWRSDLYSYGECGAELSGSTVGLVGLGEIGHRVADLALALGARVLAYDPFVEPGARRGVTLTTLEDLLAGSDVISLHARLTPDTTGMIGPEQFALMRPGTVLVNTARGGLLDYPAAAVALADGTLRALALDVYDHEPVDPAAAVLAAPNVVLSPHLAGATRQTAERAARMAAAEIARFAAGETLSYLKNGVVTGVAP